MVTISVRAKIWSLPLIAVLIFTLSTAVVVFFSTNTLAMINALGQTHLPYQEAILQLSTQLDSLKESIKGAVGEGEKSRLDEVADKGKSIDALLDRMKAIPTHEADAGELKQAYQAYFAAANETALLMLQIKQGDNAAAIAAMQEAQKKLEALLQAGQTKDRLAFSARLEGAEKGVRGSLWVTVLCGAVLTTILGVASWLIIGSVWAQLGGEPEYARDAMRRIAQGDLSQSVKLRPGDSTSLLAAVQNMTEGLRAMVSNVRNSTFSITDASRDIAAGNRHLSTRTDEQASAIAHTTSSMEQFTSMVQKTVGSAQQANELAGSTSAVAARAGEVVDQVVHTMDSISTSSKKIGDIIGMIDSIAFQTNILALNAAVEAARAGEQGRGFSVVATEVRQLAQRSAQAAKEIGSLIKDSVERVEHGSTLVQRAGETMHEVVGSVQRVTHIIAEISTASAEQASGIHAANAAIGKMDDTTHQNAEMVKQASAAARSLEQHAEALTKAVSNFKLQATE